ncbi:MAG TPA: hypothetical protein VFU47_03070 [Armatimonadota bacterium]|nr:hypothetical protein [Armatimonadota bacterium]
MQSRKELRRLRAHSREFARRLLARYPGWLEYLSARAEGDPGLLELYLEVRVPPVNPAVKEPLHVYTAEGEVTIEWFGHWHVHVPEWPKGSTGYLDEALEWIDALVSERRVVVAAAGTASATRPGEEPLWLRRLEPGQRVTVRSWRGTYDDEPEPTAPVTDGEVSKSAN